MVRRTKSGLPQYCSYAVDRHGKRRVRFRKTGFSAYLTGTPWSTDFMRQYGDALARVEKARTNISANRTMPGSFSALVVRYYRSPEFRGIKASSQRTYRGIIERFRAEYGDDLVRDLERQHVKAIIGAMADRPMAANKLLRILKMLLDFAVDIEMIRANPATRVKGFKAPTDGYHTWTEEEIAAFHARHPVGTRAQLAFSLLLYTAQRRGDVIRMGWQHVKEGRIALRQEKTGTPLRIKMHPALIEALEALPRDNLTFLTTAFGSPFTSAGFGNWFRDQCRAAELNHCSSHGLRKAASRRLAEAGNSANAIAAVTGHKTLREVARYTAAADQAHLADRAMDTMPGGPERERELSNLGTRLDKSWGN